MLSFISRRAHAFPHIIHKSPTCRLLRDPIHRPPQGRIQRAVETIGGPQTAHNPYPSCVRLRLGATLRSTSKRSCLLPLRPYGYPHMAYVHQTTMHLLEISYGPLQRTTRGFSGRINHQPNTDYQLVHKNTRGPVKSKSLPQKRRLHAITFTDRRPQSAYGSNIAGAEKF
jgi:hypothetical protein